jgi:hypothetical protein
MAWFTRRAWVVAQRQEQRIGVLQKGAGVAHHGMAQHAQLVDRARGATM